MKEKERDELDDLFRSKLYGFEQETMAEDWEAIADRLPGKAPVSFRRTLRYWAAAAVVSLLMTTGGVYVYNKEMKEAPLAREIERQKEEVESSFRAEDVEALPEKKLIAVAAPLAKKMAAPAAPAAVAAPVVVTAEDEVVEEVAPVAIAAEEAPQAKTPEATPEQPAVQRLQTRAFAAEAKPAEESPRPQVKPSRKWGLGMGAGGLTAGTSNSVNGFTLKSGAYQDMQLASMNSVSFDNQLPKTDIRHKTPISFGLSVNRYLNNRFALQAGLSYSFLSSEWTTNSRYHGESKQKLHFIGIPLSLTYKIAEWERFQLYAAAGGMAEVNVAGKVRTRLFSDGDLMESQTQHRRMKEWLWSVNARAGVSYPIVRFVSAFAEVGAGYYFDNGSDIETVHSDKPFNVSLQLGFRLGF